MGSIKRILLGIVLIALAAFVAFALKDWLDRKSPQNAVPLLTVEAGGKSVAVPATGYHWVFAFGHEAERMPSPIHEAFEQGIPKVELHGGEELDLVFSQQSDYVLIDRSIEPYTYDFFQPAENERTVPFEQGFYVYMVDATFKGGRVQYYFTVVVQQ